MSSTAHAHDAHPADHAHDDHAFDGEPAQDIPADEPRTPGWIPALGAALFLAAGIAFIATLDAPPKGASTGAGTGAAPGAAANAGPNAVAAPQAPGRAVIPPGGAAPAGDTAQPARRLTPEQLKDLQKRIQEAQQKRGEQPGAPPAGAAPTPPPGH